MAENHAVSGVLLQSDLLDGGRVELIVGPMFSGKTTELISRVRRLKSVGHHCLFVKPRKDNRYSNTSISTHDRIEVEAMTVDYLSELENFFQQFTVIAIDEGQFLPDLAKYVQMWADTGRLVMVAALDGDYKRRPFKNVVNVLPIAEDIQKRTAICTGCRGTATFSHRLTAEVGQEVVGGADKYTPLCRKCYLDHCVTDRLAAVSTTPKAVSARRSSSSTQNSLSSASTELSTATWAPWKDPHSPPTKPESSRHFNVLAVHDTSSSGTRVLSLR